jgi:hypothetical protein
MNSDAIIAALDLPAGSRVGQRVPKKLLLENGAPTAADKRLINAGIEELVWLAALKPTTIGVPEYHDADREYLEIAVLRLTFRTVAGIGRLVELVHRAVPYPVLLLIEGAGLPGISAAHKRWSQGEAGKTVLEGDVVAVELDDGRDAGSWPAFHDALALGRQPRASLLALYQGWVDTLLAWKAARVTGAFALCADAVHAAGRRDALKECARLDAEIDRLRAAAGHERQVNRQVELNREVKRLEAQRTSAMGSL